MELFAALFQQLDQSVKTNDKVEALATYFQQAVDADKLWTMALLSHRRPKRTVSTTLMQSWAAEQAGIPLWLFEESYHVVGDLAETIALVLSPGEQEANKTLAEWVEYIMALQGMDEALKKEAILQAWNHLKPAERFIFNKIITGGFRMGVSQKLMVKALSKATQVDENKLAHRLMGDWTPLSTTFSELLFDDNVLEDASKPYPFFLAYALEDTPESLGGIADWQAEYKWDGIRGQLIVRQQEVFIWSRGEELVTDSFPELHEATRHFPDGTVLDGEILPFKNQTILPFQLLQTRLGRKNITSKLLLETPVAFYVYDIVEWQGNDLRQTPLSDRRFILETLIPPDGLGGVFYISPLVTASSWAQVAEARENASEQNSEGVMLKRKSSAYGTGRKKGDWWKWKVAPMTVDAVMIYAQSGHGRRANLFTDFTFAVWDGDKLVPFTKAYSGLTDAEFVEISAWVRQNTIERFGPVRSVPGHHVFEIAFEGIALSSRHKSGVALRFPRMLRWRKDKPAHEADTLETLKALIPM